LYRLESFIFQKQLFRKIAPFFSKRFLLKNMKIKTKQEEEALRHWRQCSRPGSGGHQQ
jgi:hypothetical protein